MRPTVHICFAEGLQRSFLVTIGLIFIHRNFFARALRENPTNPIRSRFGPSFLAAYASAITLLRAMRRNFEPCQQVLLRIWPFWAHALASGVRFFLTNERKES